MMDNERAVCEMVDLVVDYDPEDDIDVVDVHDGSDWRDFPCKNYAENVVGGKLVCGCHNDGIHFGKRSLRSTLRKYPPASIN